MHRQQLLKSFTRVSFFLLCSSCSHFNPFSNRSPADVIPPVAGEEWGPQNDAQAEQILELSEKMLAARTGKSTPVRRDAHPKQHGCPKAFVDINSSALPAEYRVGVFAPPANGSKSVRYLAWTRFSNGSPGGVNSPDFDKDIRGFAMKLMNVDGSESGSQDFVLSTSSEFFSENGSEYTSFHKALSDGNVSLLAWLAFHPKFAVRLEKSRVQVGNVLHTPYYSTVPYRLGGDNSMKFSTTPCTPQSRWDSVPSKDEATPNYLRERLVARLKTPKTACFDFWVQPNMDPIEQPVEDPTVKWDDDDSPKYRVGRITFLANQTDIDSDQQNNLCENMSFDPWHSLPETRPLGQINRIRKIVYSGISEYRHQRNGLTVSEPKDHQPCDQPGSTLCTKVSQ
jgi:catalase